MAGAGTGKTTTLIEKIAYLIETGKYKPDEILCLTYSNEATNDLKNKLSEKVKFSSDVTVKTFHSFFAELLREHGGILKIEPDFEILLPDDAKVMLNRYFDIPPYHAQRYISTMATAREFSITLDDIKKHTAKILKEFNIKGDLDEYAEKKEYELKTLHLESAETKEERKEQRAKKKDLSGFLKDYLGYTNYTRFIEAWENYEKLKKEKNLLDFSDLTNFALELFRKFDLREVTNQYKYVFVDEFQDTNKQQFELIENLAKSHGNITIVGDQNQSIYGFRGAYKESFEHFEKAFKVTDKDRFFLDKSYRSPNTVLRVAHKLIVNNYSNPKECPMIENGEKREGQKVKCFRMLNKNEEARKVAELVEEEIDKGTPLKEICVLFRTHAQGKLIRKALEAKKIPIIGAGETDLLSRREISTVIAHLSMLNNLRERTGTGEQAWWNLFHYNNRLSPEDTMKIGHYIKSKSNTHKSIDEAVLSGIDKIQLSEEGERIVGRVITVSYTHLTLPTKRIV